VVLQFSLLCFPEQRWVLTGLFWVLCLSHACSFFFSSSLECSL
jgi:hypothetical protein